MSLAQVERPKFTKTNGNGVSSAATVLQEALHLPRPWWTQLFKWENNLIVSGRTIEKGWVIPQPLGIALILLILSGVGTIYWRLDSRIDAKDQAYQEQRDMLIEIKTELKLSKEHEAEARQRLEHQLGDLAAWQQVTNKDLARIVPKKGNNTQQ